MRVLPDTNIIIHREASKVVNTDIGILFNWLDKLHYTKCVHPLTGDELSRNINIDNAKTMQVKLANYHLLKTEAPLNEELKKVSDSIDKTPNDKNDSKLLNEVINNRVDILISEDKRIHTKAAMLGISDRVFRIDTFLEKMLAENPELVDYKVLAVKKEYFGNVNLQDPFFNSFRSDYIGFDKWFNDKSDETAYVCFDNGVLSAFLYVKPENEKENYDNISPKLAPAIRLKVGTLKVTSNGIKLGERFLKIIFDNARQYKADEIYLTIFDKRPEQLRLISLVEEYGFKYHGEKTTLSGMEKVYIRDFRKNADVLHPKISFPWLSKETNVFVVPIRPEYHTKLFPDSILRTESPMDSVDNEPYRNAISKVYVSHSLNRALKPGDILVFYRTGGMYKGVATTIGIVENVITDLKAESDLIELCHKRSVLSEAELKEYWAKYPKNRPFVINFLYAFSFKKRITLKEMLDSGILPNMEAVKTITQLERGSFTKLINLSGI
jgi:predicted nucleic acid-binding protein